MFGEREDHHFFRWSDGCWKCFINLWLVELCQGIEEVLYLKDENHWRVKVFFFFSLTMMKFREIAEGRPASLVHFSCTAKKKKGESVLNSCRCRQVKRQRHGDTCLFVQPFLNRNTEVQNCLDFVCHVPVSPPQVRQWCRWQLQMLMTPPTETAPGWCTVYCKDSHTSLWNLRQVRLSLQTSTIQLKICEQLWSRDKERRYRHAKRLNANS